MMPKTRPDIHIDEPTRPLYTRTLSISLETIMCRVCTRPLFYPSRTKPSSGINIQALI